MAKDTIEMEGIVSEAHTSSDYKIKLENGVEVHGILSGKMRKFNIKILPGDRVRIELSPYDLTKGRITYRLK